jgi:hypothetical protein
MQCISRVDCVPYRWITVLGRTSFWNYSNKPSARPIEPDRIMTLLECGCLPEQTTLTVGRCSFHCPPCCSNHIFSRLLMRSNIGGLVPEDSLAVTTIMTRWPDK